MNYMHSRLLAPMLLLSTLATAPAQAQGYEAGSFRVHRITVDGSGALVTLSPAPASCQGSAYNQEHLLLPADAGNRDQIYSALLSAYVAGEKIESIWFSNSGPCSTAPLRITGVRMMGK
jgi:hypothetical protein